MFIVFTQESDDLQIISFSLLHPLSGQNDTEATDMKPISVRFTLKV